MKVGKHFSLEEFTVSQTAARRGLKNEPPPEVTQNIQGLVNVVLDPFADHNNIKVIISSGYRSPEVNKAVGGAKTSQHVKGQAADILIPGWTVERVCLKIQQMKLPFDQLIDEFGQWTHVSFVREPGKNRGEFLKARKIGGKTVYTKVVQNDTRSMG